MRKLLFIVAISLLAGCSIQKNMAVVYRELVKGGKITMDDYFFLIDQEKELNEMKGVKR